jgi:hypothetical protein
MRKRRRRLVGVGSSWWASRVWNGELGSKLGSRIER